MAYKVQYIKRFTSGLLKGINVPCVVTHPTKEIAEDFETWLKSKDVHRGAVTKSTWTVHGIQVREVPNNG